MAPANTMKLVLKGHSASGEIWQSSLWFNPVTIGDSVPTTNTDAQLVLNNLLGVAQVGTWLAGIYTNLLGPDGGIDAVALYCYPTGGRLAAAIAQAPFVHPGGSAGTSLPVQSCCVVSLRTDQAGRSFRGRMYYPAEQVTLTAHQFSNTFISGLSTQLAGALSAVKTAPILPNGHGIFGVVASDTRNVASVITSVIVDSKPDTQRRRSMKIPPSFQVTTAVTL